MQDHRRNDPNPTNPKYDHVDIHSHRLHFIALNPLTHIYVSTPLVNQTRQNITPSIHVKKKQSPNSNTGEPSPHITHSKRRGTMATSTNPQPQESQEEQPWHAAFPAPRLEAGLMPKQRAQMILSMKIASMLIIDVRRTDYEGGAIRGSLNIPAQGFWWNRGML
jgi:hypothetical protein